jgi:hypothetical protein
METVTLREFTSDFVFENVRELLGNPEWGCEYHGTGDTQMKIKHAQTRQAGSNHDTDTDFPESGWTWFVSAGFQSNTLSGD